MRYVFSDPSVWRVGRGGELGKETTMRIRRRRAAEEGYRRWRTCRRRRRRGRRRNLGHPRKYDDNRDSRSGPERCPAPSGPRESSNIIAPPRHPQAVKRVIETRSPPPHSVGNLCITKRVDVHGSPRAYNCFVDEGLNAMLRSLAVFAHRNRFEMRVFSMWDIQGALKVSLHIAPGLIDSVALLYGHHK